MVLYAIAKVYRIYRITDTLDINHNDTVSYRAAESAADET